MTTWTINKRDASCETQYHGAYRVRRIDTRKLKGKMLETFSDFIQRLYSLAAAGRVRLYDFR